MSQTLLPLAGFEVTFNGRFWVTAEAMTISSMNAPLNEEELRHLRATTLFLGAYGKNEWVEEVEAGPPEFQRLMIQMHHLWLDYPDSFQRRWKWTLRFYQIRRRLKLLKKNASHIFSSRVAK
jgi:hypothetical protein